MTKNRRDTSVRDPGAAQLDLVSYGRRGPTSPRTFTREQLEQLARTTSRAPEVIVKVTGGGRDAGGVEAHFSYVGRDGSLEIETDDGQLVSGKGVGKELVENWDLDIYTHRIGRKLSKEEKRRTPKLAHNIVLSMPSATDGQKVLAAAQAFAREKFALTHRYAMVLHTDTKHPHVHLVVKAESEEGPRLYIRKATLREWRTDFARHLGDQGIVANATPRALRGKSNSSKPDGVHRADLRGASTHMRERRRGVARDMRDGKPIEEPGKARLEDTRRQVVADWKRSLGTLIAQNQPDLANKTARFIKSMPPVQTEREAIAEALAAKVVKRELPGPGS